MFTPFALCLASLVCIILVFLGGWNAHNTTLGNFYFLKVCSSTAGYSKTVTDRTSQADLTKFTVNNTGLDLVPGTNLDNDVLNRVLNQAKAAANVKDFYTIYLWNYCSWDGSDKYSFCSKREAYFAFDPVEVWGLEKTGVENAFPKQLQDGLKAYKAVSKWMFIAYLVALVATIVELVVGISALFSRWGSFCTTFVSTVS